MPEEAPADATEEKDPTGATAEAVPSEIAHAPVPRPPFAADWPHDAELDRLLAYLARGNHRAVRDGADVLAEKATDPKVAAAARDLRRRIEPDPIARILLGATFVLLMVLTLWAIHRSRELHAVPPPPAQQVQIVK